MAIKTGQVSVGTSATEIHTESQGAFDGALVTVKNAGTNDVFLGDANVTTSNGYALAPGDVLPIDLVQWEGLYGIVASGTETVHKLVSGE